MLGTFRDDYYLYIVMEYVIGGEFFSVLRKNRRFENDAARFYAAQVTTIFEYLHGRNIIYRDLKPENLLVDSEGYLKLTDFGFAKVIETRTYTLCGTPEYIAPEVLLNKGHGKPVDWWTMGILIYEMIVGYPPFFDDEPMGVYQKILGGRIVFPKSFDRNAKMLVKRLLTPDLTKRYGNLKNGVADIKEHKWFAGFDWSSLMKKQLTPPYKPVFKAMDDTSNFDTYPESTEQPPPVTGMMDPFTSWCTDTVSKLKRKAVRIRDPELWERLTASLPAIAKAAAAPEAELTLCCFSSILKTGEGRESAAALVCCCLPHIATALRLLPPTHALLPVLLQAVLDCYQVQQLSPHVQQNMKLLLQLGESFQSIFASDAAKAEVQQLALQLLQHLFITLPHACKDVFIEEICIVDWLLEAARNGKPIARKGVQCLQQHVFNSPAFLQQHHLDASAPTQQMQNATPDFEIISISLLLLSNGAAASVQQLLITSSVSSLVR
ncbi:AGC kinase, putative [Eimeria acervulina]|uniref:AGC kinase, putative n=1 Tax=Eimeria acervulina TaxID=5801 RepID=U6GJC6_EIMAC|nr:AGC kinase, putative [Eimeria acervulina]CDI80341.1 AGC kinase, putative [Eimeria acervulina]